MTTTRTLSDIMDFDHVIEVHPDGTVADAPRDLWAPESPLDPDIHETEYTAHGRTWRLLNGYSGQDRYSGPWMHNSEYIGGQLERDILAEPGYYVAIYAQWTPEDGDEDSELDIEGWAVAYRPREDETLIREDETLVDAIARHAGLVRYRGGFIECAHIEAIKRTERED